MIADNINRLLDRIDKKCIQSNRSKDEIKLVAVSKTFGVAEILEAADNGLVHFGENKAQELLSKYDELKEKVTWHFIGHLQRNKAKLIVNCAEFIHSIDSLRLAEEVSRQAERVNKVQKILLEVKTSGEASKFGLTNGEELIKAASYCRDDANLDLLGLMTMAPFTSDEKEIRRCFIQLRNLKEKLNKEGFNFKELSMGMTNDFEIAIEEGATILRIGSAIFGERIYNND